MFYRQKLLLAMVEIFGGLVKKTDFQELMFLLCETLDEKHYEFFPHYSGAFSLMSYFDKRKLTEKGILP